MRACLIGLELVLSRFSINQEEFSEPIRCALIFYITTIGSLYVYSDNSSQQVSDEKSSGNKHTF